MQLLKIITYPDPFLRQVAKDVDLADGVEAWRPFADELVRAMRAYDGVAIAAPQVGASIRMIAVDLNSGKKGAHSFPLVLVNPVVHDLSRETELDAEGCLSFPGATARIARAKTCLVDYTAMDGEHVVGHVFEGLLARAVQHEVEHLDGRLLIDHIESRIKRDMIQRKARRAKKRGGLRPKIPPELKVPPELS